MEVTNDPQALANDYIINVDHTDWGKIKMTGFPWDFSDTPATCRTRAPTFGEHTDEILSGIGYSKEDINKLKEEKVII